MKESEEKQMDNGRVRWYYWQNGWVVELGRMPIKQIDQNLRLFERAAAEILRETGADHVLYGLKKYDENGELSEVRFYQEPMTDERFEKDVASMTDTVVYALHARK